ncbi:MAG: hypothetical protein ACXVJY_18345 [Ilumatobacteraceae bacterium]
MIRSRRLALVAIVFAFGIAACGEPSSTTPAANQPKVIQLAGSQGGTSAERAPAAAMPSGGATADSKMAVFGATKFVYDGQLPALDGAAASWFFAAGQNPDPQRIAKLAASLGVQGDVRSLPQDQGGGWAVGPEDYSGPVLTVGADGMLSWWLSSAQTAVTSGCAIAAGGTAPDAGSGAANSTGGAVVAPPSETAPAATAPAADVPVPVPVPVPAPVPTTVSVPDCPAPQPPAGVPTKDEALAKAKQLFASWGYDVNSYQFDDPYADEWNASVNASLVVGGMKAPITLSVGFGGNGVVTYAAGTLAVPQQGADYPTVGAAKGLERLKTQQFQYLGVGGGGGVMKAATDQVAPQTTVAGTTGAAPSTAGAAPAIVPVCQPDTSVAKPLTDSTIAVDTNATPPAIVDCVPINPEPITVTLNSVKRDLSMVWDTDGTIWLLPAYTFGSADGGAYTVIAVDDSFIQAPAPEPATTEPVQNPNSTVPVPDTVLVPVPDTASVAATVPVTDTRPAASTPTP